MVCIDTVLLSVFMDTNTEAKDYPIQCLFCTKSILGGEDDVFGYGMHQACFLKSFGLTEPKEFTSLARQKSISSPQTPVDERWRTSFFGGNYKKYSAILGDESYILKVRQQDHPQLPNVEYVCNVMARQLQLPVPNFYLIDFMGMRTFVSKNFIGVRSQSVDLKHIYHYLPEGHEPYNCETVLQVILETTKRLSDGETFIRLCLYDGLIGNDDRHGRNLAFLVTPKGTTLAPIYDNNSSLGLEEGAMLQADWNPTGKIATSETLEPSAAHYLREFRRMGHGKVVKEFVEKVSIEICERTISESFCSAPMKQALSRLVNKRYQEMKRELQKESK